MNAYHIKEELIIKKIHKNEKCCYFYSFYIDIW